VWAKVEDVYMFEAKVEDVYMFQANVEAYLEELQGISTDFMAHSDRVNYNILKDTLVTYIDGHRWARFVLFRASHSHSLDH
jgi:hypothetical protein